MAGAERTRLFGALRHRDFRFMVAALAASQTGDWLYNVALIVFILEQTGSAAWVAIAGVVRLLPYVVLGPIGGAIADRRPRKRVMIQSDLIRAATMFALAAAAFANAPVVVAVALAGLATVFAVAYAPCVNAAIPSIVGEQDLSAANALSTTVTNLSYALGPAVGGALLLLGSPEMAFVVNGVTFMGSALATVPIRTPLGPSLATDEHHGRVPRFFDGMFDGIALLVSSSGVLVLVAASVASNVLYGQETVLYALVATDRLGMSVDGVAFLYAAIGVGGILAAGLAHRAADRTHQGAALTLAAIGCGVPMFTLAFVSEPGLAYALLLVEGAAMIVLDVLVITSLQRLLGADVLGRAFGALDSLIVAGILIGSITAPIVVSLASLEIALLLGGGVTIAAGVAVMMGSGSIDRAAAREAARLAPRIAVLEGLEILDGASRATLEHLASIVVDEQVDAGTTVISQGDVPDDLFIVVDGSLDASVIAEGVERTVGSIDGGEVFGEIGLLRSIPRTATVRARTECSLFRLPGAEFLEIVSSGAVQTGAIARTVQSRMAATRAASSAPERA